MPEEGARPPPHTPPLLHFSGCRTFLLNVWLRACPNSRLMQTFRVQSWCTGVCLTGCLGTSLITSSQPLSMSGSCVPQRAEHASWRGHTAPLATERSRLLDLDYGTVFHRTWKTYNEFRRSLETFLFGQWGHGAVWTLLTAPIRNIRTYLLTYVSFKLLQRHTSTLLLLPPSPSFK